ncbi:MAG: hypothetical protein KA116_06375 [Proteobacteria bacterium]|nr:hypothetical protein [Pseudomonadota bacterium]
MSFMKNVLSIGALACSLSFVQISAHEPTPALKQELDRAIAFIGMAQNNLRFNDVMSADRNLLQASFIVARYESDRALDQAHHDVDFALNIMRSRRLPYYDMVNQVNYLSGRAVFNIQNSVLYRACSDHGRDDHGRDDHGRDGDWDHGRGDHGRGESCKWYTQDAGFTVPAFSGRRAVKGCSNNTESGRVFVQDSRVYADRGLSCSTEKTNRGKDLLISCRNSSRQNLRVDRVQLYCCTR